MHYWTWFYLAWITKFTSYFCFTSTGFVGCKVELPTEEGFLSVCWWFCCRKLFCTAPPWAQGWYQPCKRFPRASPFSLGLYLPDYSLFSSFHIPLNNQLKPHRWDSTQIYANSNTSQQWKYSLLNLRELWGFEASLSKFTARSVSSFLSFVIFFGILLSHLHPCTSILRGIGQ